MVDSAFKIAVDPIFGSTEGKNGKGKKLEKFKWELIFDDQI